MKQRPICYLDVDGVLYYYPEEGTEDFKLEGAYAGIRPYIMGLLQTIHNCGYELRMLTCNHEGGNLLLRACLKSGYYPLKWRRDPKTNEKKLLEFTMPEDIPSCYLDYTNYKNNLDHGIYSKAAFIDWSRNFIWIEDGILPKEEELLKEKGREDCYCYVDRFKREELQKVMRWVKEHRLTKEYLEDNIITPLTREEPRYKK